MEFIPYPTQDFGPIMKGMVIGGLGILHVFLAQFAIGGGMLLCYFQWLAQTGRSQVTRSFVDGYFRVLVLISFVVGALTGVGMWFTTIQISPRTIGKMVMEFHWIWATEWTFFSLEVASGYCFYRYGKKLSDRARFQLLLIYSIAAWFSLFWINGILSWQLTPGRWLETRYAWDGFFNASFFPSLLFRTVTSMATAGLVAIVVINFTKFDREQRLELIRHAAKMLSPMILMLPLGIWYFAVIPDDSRSWVMGGSIAMTLFMTLGVGCSVLIGGYAFIALVGKRIYINGATAGLLCILGLMATAGAEFVREGIRKPFTIRNYLYSNSISIDELPNLRLVGAVPLASRDPYPLAPTEEFPNSQLERGARVFRLQCSVCHTIDGANGVVHLAQTWSLSQMRLNIAQLQRTKPFMPPFAGSADEVEAVVQFLKWNIEGTPDQWKETTDDNNILQIQRWMDEAGSGPGTKLVDVEATGNVEEPES